MTPNNQAQRSRTLHRETGFTLIEVVIASCLLAVSLLFLAGMFATGYTQVTKAGRSTTGLAVARQIIEEARTLPFERIANLNGFSTDNPNTQPQSDPERRVARRWRYALAGEGAGWDFTSTERTSWAQLASRNGGFSARGTVQITAPTATSARITATVTVTGHPRSFTLATVIARR